MSGRNAMIRLVSKWEDVTPQPELDFKLFHLDHIPYDMDQETTTVYAVVINRERMMTIWDANRQCPLGWRRVGKYGVQQDCLNYIKAAWTADSQDPYPYELPDYSDGGRYKVDPRFLTVP